MTNHKAIGLQIDELVMASALGEQEVRLCFAFYSAILSTQSPEWHRPLPRILIQKVLTWRAKYEMKETMVLGPIWEQLAGELRSTNKSSEDIELCQALLGALMLVVETRGGEVIPKGVRRFLLRWYNEVDFAMRTQTELIGTMVAIAEQSHGLRRTRGHKLGGKTAYEYAADRLNISPNTAANKAGEPAFWLKSRQK